jgi:hypothetical protein
MSPRGRQALIVGLLALLVVSGVAWVAATEFELGSRTGGAIVAGAIVFVVSAAAVVGRKRN